MISPSLRAWATGIGSIMVLHTDQFFIASINGAAQIPAYRAAYLVLLNLNVMAVTAAGASTVFISHLWQAGQIAEVHRVIVRNLRLGLGVMAAGGACILVLGPRLFDAWLGNGNFAGYPILCIFFFASLSGVPQLYHHAGFPGYRRRSLCFWALGGGVLKLTLSALLGARFWFGRHRLLDADRPVDHEPLVYGLSGAQAIADQPRDSPDERDPSRGGLVHHSGAGGPVAPRGKLGCERVVGSSDRRGHCWSHSLRVYVVFVLEPSHRRRFTVWCQLA